ncbi:MAG: transposase [Clostridia bacterium]
MSRKNHKVVNGRLIQTNKRFADLKISQKEKIYKWLLDEYLLEIEKSEKSLDRIRKDGIVFETYKKIESAEIWIPYYEVEKYFSSKLSKWNKKYRK